MDAEVADSKEATILIDNKTPTVVVDKEYGKPKFEDFGVVKQEVKKENSRNMDEVRVKVEKKIFFLSLSIKNSGFLNT